MELDKDKNMFRTLLSLILLVLLVRWKWDELRALLTRYIDLDWDYEVWSPGVESEKTEAFKAATAAAPVESSDLVYVTSAGTRYHQAGCRSLGDGGRPVPLNEARADYQPCGRCKPPA